jgi:hypothetical protein
LINLWSGSIMDLHIHGERGWLLLLLALTAPVSAATESAAPDGGIPQAPPSVVATTPPPAPAVSKPKSRPRLSPDVISQITSDLPPWNAQAPAPAEEPPPPPQPQVPTDPEVVEMAPVIVRAAPLPRTDKLDWLTPRAKDAELVNTYITPFDRDFLSLFTLPLFGISKEARAREMYEEDKRLRDINWVDEQIDDAKRFDSKEAKDLQYVRDTSFDRPEP